MEFVPFRKILPAIAKKETRALLVLQETNGLPKGDYVFSDSYCSDPECDCRRTFINVLCVKGALKGLHLATIGYGWETVRFYAKWMHGDYETGMRMAGVALEAMQVQSDYAAPALHAFRRCVFDERYEERIRRHYAAFKEEIRRRKAADVPVGASGPKAGRDDPCVCGATKADGRPKKYKKCCGC